MLSTQHHDALQTFSGEVQQLIYKDTDRLANDGSINHKIIDFMEYLIDKTSNGGGTPSGNGGGPPGGPPDKGGNSNSSSSSSSSVDSLTTSKKT